MTIDHIANRLLYDLPSGKTVVVYIHTNNDSTTFSHQIPYKVITGLEESPRPGRSGAITVFF